MCGDPGFFGVRWVDAGQERLGEGGDIHSVAPPPGNNNINNGAPECPSPPRCSGESGGRSRQFSIVIRQFKGARHRKLETAIIAASDQPIFKSTTIFEPSAINKSTNNQPTSAIPSISLEDRQIATPRLRTTLPVACDLVQPC